MAGSSEKGIKISIRPEGTPQFFIFHYSFFIKNGLTASAVRPFVIRTSPGRRKKARRSKGRKGEKGGEKTLTGGIFQTCPTRSSPGAVRVRLKV